MIYQQTLTVPWCWLMVKMTCNIIFF